MIFIVSFVNYDKKASLESQGYNIGASQSEISTRNCATKISLDIRPMKTQVHVDDYFKWQIILSNFEALVESFRSIMRWFVGLFGFATSFWLFEMEIEWTANKNAQLEQLFTHISYATAANAQRKNNESRKNFLLSFSISSASLHFTAKCT